jgi:PAS domain S-box-containing protein
MRALYKSGLLIFLGFLFSVPACHGAGQQPSARNVLVLYGAFSTDHQYLDVFESMVRAHVPGQVTFYVALMDVPEGDAEPYQESLAETLRREYSHVKLDLIITIFTPALRFAALYRDKIFPGVPIVFTQTTARELDDQMKRQGVTGVTVPVDFRRTIDLALHLHPDTNAIAVVTDSWWLATAHSELLRWQDKVREIDLVGPANSQLLERVAALPPHTVALFLLGPNGSKLSPITNWDVLRLTSQRMPTYSPWPSLCLNRGCIGGAYPDPFKEDQWTAELAARVLLGEQAENIPIVNDSDVQVEVDWREIRRWHIAQSSLPSGAVVLYREPSLWERGRKYFVIGIAVITAQALLIFGLIWQRARKRRVEAVLRESEKRFRVMADTTPSLIWMCDESGKVTYVNEQWTLFTDWEPNSAYGDAWSSYFHPDDLKAVLGRLAGALEARRAFSIQHRLRRRDGTYRWVFNVASPRINGDGSFGGFIGSAVDISDQKMAQDALERVSGQLIEAQEKERTRLARELHDDICQRLAMLSIKMERAASDPGRGQKSIAAKLEQFWKECSDLAGDVQALSHKLHPSILDNLGLAVAVKGFCREVSEQNEVVVEFVGKNIPNTLQREISLSLFRVVQEALHNAVKYSGEKYFQVRLEANGSEMELEVGDGGIGFDATSAKNGGGLGLVSMAERIHQVNGTFSIDSQPNAGTRIHARVPLAAQAKAMTNAAN